MKGTNRFKAAIEIIGANPFVYVPEGILNAILKIYVTASQRLVREVREEIF